MSLLVQPKCAAARAVRSTTPPSACLSNHQHNAAMPRSLPAAPLSHSLTSLASLLSLHSPRLLATSHVPLASIPPLVSPLDKVSFYRQHLPLSTPSKATDRPQYVFSWTVAVKGHTCPDVLPSHFTYSLLFMSRSQSPPLGILDRSPSTPTWSTFSSV